MKKEIKDINEFPFTDLFPPCDRCIYWEAPEKLGKVEEGEAIKIKCDWFKKTQAIFGCCGKILYVGGKAVGYSQYAPPQFFSNVADYSQQLFLPNSDAILISCLYIQEGYRKKKLGTKLLQRVLEDLRKGGYHAVETYSRDDSANSCSGSTEFYFKNGFKLLKTKNWETATFSLVRLELGNGNEDSS